jgi:hypothetical protein
LPINNFDKTSLRERKKLKTIEAIQHQALQLFLKQGYDNTTVEQIAEAAEVSLSTFFFISLKRKILFYANNMNRSLFI